MLRDDIATTGMTYETRRRHNPNPSLPAYWEAQKRLAAGLAALGLSPGDRSRLGIA